jgi:hypothetical protein
MAYLSHCCAGNTDPDRFNSLQEFKDFMKDEKPMLEQYCDVLWNSGFRSFFAIAQALRLDTQAVLQLIDPTLNQKAVKAFTSFVLLCSSALFPCISQSLPYPALNSAYNVNHLATSVVFDFFP